MSPTGIAWELYRLCNVRSRHIGLGPRVDCLQPLDVLDCVSLFSLCHLILLHGMPLLQGQAIIHIVVFFFRAWSVPPRLIIYRVLAGGTTARSIAWLLFDSAEAG